MVQFIRNKCLRLWMDEANISNIALISAAYLSYNDLQCYCAVLAHTFPFAARLNSQARQASADRAWFAINRFFENCKNKKPGKKGYPRFQHDNRSVEYKTTGWKLQDDGKHIRFTDGCGIGRLRLVGNPKQHIETFPLKQIKRVRIVRRADGYYVQFCVKAERKIEHIPTGKQVGIDVGLLAFYTDSEGNTVENPRHYRKAENKLKRLHRQVSRKKKGSQNRKKARKLLAKGYLKVQRQREDFARNSSNKLRLLELLTANTLVTSHDLIAYEDLQIRNMVRNHHLAKSIHYSSNKLCLFKLYAGWGQFITWVNAYGAMHDIPIIAVAPQFTSQQCSECGTMV